ncbi:MAG: hypothetical protein HRU23_15530 [Gammaproteobacteria bacterium]|nr:hypothetical protein [Gammaproteobacteria bacterium]
MNIAPLLLAGLALVSTSVLATGDDLDDWDNWQDELPTPIESSWQPLSGFGQLAYGSWLTNNDILPLTNSLSELRLRLETAYQADTFEFKFKLDALYDQAMSEFKLQPRQVLLSGNFADVVPLPALAAAPVLNNLSFKLGRQVVTWGTGDLVFINDLFRKDWRSFFNGRDDQYLKAPIDVVKLSYFGQRLNLDLIWQPRFVSDRYIDGQRFSFYDPLSQKIIVPSSPLTSEQQPHGAIAARLYFTYHQADIGIYVNHGYRGTPIYRQHVSHQDINQQNSAFYHPQLSTLGASIISPLAAGLVNVELGYHDYESTDQNAPSDQVRLLVGYQQELQTRLTMSGQFYLEHDTDHQKQSTDASRQVLTLGLTHRSANDKWHATLFGFISPNQHDSYARASLRYRANDQLQLVLGTNIFNGDAARFFGQFQLNNNAYLRLTYYY